MSDRVLVDTSAWIEYFQKARSAAGAKLDTMLSENDIYVPKVVIAELIQGARSDREKTVIKDLVEAFTIIDQDEDTWIEAGELSYRLKRRGMTVNLTDCYISVIAKTNECRIFTLDRHFEEIKKDFGIALEPV